jgi:hypothetical protein
MTLPEYVDFDLVIEAEGDDFVARVINAHGFLLPDPDTGDTRREQVAAFGSAEARFQRATDDAHDLLGS